MNFKKFSCNTYSYGDATDSVDKKQHFDFSDPQYQLHVNDENHPNKENLIDFVTSLALCHTVIPHHDKLT